MFAQICPSFTSYVQLSDRLWAAVNETREVNPARVPVPEKYATWTKMDVEQDRKVANAMSSFVRNMTKGEVWWVRERQKGIVISMSDRLFR